MDIENRLITTRMMVYLSRYRDDQGLVEKYKHPNGTWRNDDATIKWAGSMIIFDKLAKKGMRVVDLGAGDGPVAHMIADRGYDVVGVDVKAWDFSISKSSCHGD